MERRLATFVAIVVVSVVAIGFAAPVSASGSDDLSAAQTAIGAGQIDEAIRLYTRALASSDLGAEDRAFAFTSLANIHDDRGESDLALADYAQAIAAKPDYYWSYYNRGVLYAKQSPYPKAFADFDKAIALNPQYAPTYQARANAYDDTGGFEKAMADYDKAISLRANDPTIYDDRGISQAGRGKYAPALADFDRAIALDPQYGKAYSDRGNIEYDLGQFEKAIADFGSALQYRPDYAAALRTRGAAFLMLGKFTNADADFTRIASLQPTVEYNLLWLYLARSKADLGTTAEVTTLSAKFDPQNGFTTLLAALNGALSRDGLNAFAQGVAASNDESYRCTASFFLGETYAMRKDAAAAKAAYQQARSGCDPLSLEREAASVELSRL
jgi:tetratricopeptide (TPR) repeat protein